MNRRDKIELYLIYAFIGLLLILCGVAMIGAGGAISAP